MTKQPRPYAASASLTDEKARRRANSDLVTVPAASSMSTEIFRLHMRKRHQRVPNEFLTHHRLDHARNKKLDHRHED